VIGLGDRSLGMTSLCLQLASKEKNLDSYRGTLSYTLHVQER
jgi:hypothetical protein